MVSRFLSHIPRRAKILIAFIVVIFLSYFVLQFLSLEPRVVPEEFLKARQEAAEIAKEIVALSSETATNIEKIAILDSERRYRDALILVSEEIKRNQKAREKALELAVQLEAMASTLDRIAPASIGQLALQAISSETQLMSHLLSYNDSLANLLEEFRDKFTGIGDGSMMGLLIVQINSEARAINELNEKFNELMAQFDSVE